MKDQKEKITTKCHAMVYLQFSGIPFDTASSYALLRHFLSAQRGDSHAAMLRSPNLLQLFSKHCTNPLVTLAVYLCKSTVVLLRFFFPKCFSLHTTLKTAQNSNFQVLLPHLILGEAVCFDIKLQSVRQKGERFSNFSLLALSPKGKCSSYRTI